MHVIASMTLDDWGRVLSLPISFLILCLVMWAIHLVKPDQPTHAIDSRNYQPPPHQHVIDFDRSRLLQVEGGAVLARCCMQGCNMTVTIGRNVVEMLIEEGVSH